VGQEVEERKEVKIKISNLKLHMDMQEEEHLDKLQRNLLKKDWLK
jgi:hypothetical protein